MTSYNLEHSEQTAAVLPANLSLKGDTYERSKGSSKRIFGTTVALLNQSQAELDSARKEIAQLRNRLSELEKLATTDLLTGIKNLRGFNESMRAELDRVRRQKSLGGVIMMIDLNGFKAINDTYGHQAGDQCLRLVGQTLIHDLRGMDTAARLGGDEFVLLLTDTTVEKVAGRAQQIITRLNSLSIVWDGVEIPIFASVGIKGYSFGDKAEDIIAAADQDMYANKRRSKKQATVNA